MSEDTDRRIAEGEKIIRKKLPVARDVNVSINTSNIEKLIEHNKELELENRQLREGKVPTSQEFQEEAEFDDKMHKFVRTMKRVEKEIEQEDALNEAEENDYDVREGGKGSVKLSPEQRKADPNYSGNEKSFRSHAELVSYLKSEIRKGNETAKKQYRELVSKAIRGLKERNIVWEDTKEGDSMISYTLKERNKRLREQHLKNKGD
jgi:regulator of replication initiation timing